MFRFFHNMIILQCTITKKRPRLCQFFTFQMRIYFLRIYNLMLNPNSDPNNSDHKYRIVLVQNCQQVQDGQDVKRGASDTLKDFVIYQGSSFWSVEDDYEAIYNSFNILSYFSSSCKIRILQKVKNEYYFSVANQFLQGKENQQKKQKKKKIENKKYVLCQQKRQEFQKKKFQKKLTIDYSIYEGTKNNKNGPQYKIKVKFGIQKQELKKQNKIKFLKFQNRKPITSEEREQIIIDIFDSDGWIKANFENENENKNENNTETTTKTKQKQRLYNRMSQILKPRLGEIEYFYQEPQNLRNKIIKDNLIKVDHISLALQGGGCKGVQYIGAYKAILQKDIPITSVIGSSAGGIIGLAVCCQLDPSEILKICTEKLCKVTDDQKYKQVNQEEQDKLNKIYQNVIKLVEELNIFDETIVKIIKKFLENPDFKKLLLEYIRIMLDPEVAKLFAFPDGKLNLYGLLNAALMTGQKIRQIASEILKLFLYKKSRDKNFPQYSDIKNFQEYCNLLQEKQKMQGQSKQLLEKMTQICEKLTMAQLYQLNGVQFTCTAVDLDDHILRFFNKKTTPNLPVCSAVQMTGSFPVAFEAQRWKQKWGKYLIHYDNIRRQIDLTNHRFTDGGTLSNFPIKYLDNEQMRPMYFSHAKTQQTKIFGIGFIQVEKKDADKQQKLRKKKQQIEDFLKLEVVGFRDKFLGFLKWTFRYDSNPKPKPTKISPTKIQKILKQIPLIEFVFNILETYSKTKDNLIKQCFAHVTFELKASQNYIKEIKHRVRPKSLKYEINKLISLVEKLANQSNKAEDIYSCFKANLGYFAKNQLNFSCFEEKLCYAQRIVISNFESFLSYLSEDSTQQEQLVQNRLANCIRQRKISSKNDDREAILEFFKRLRSIREEKVFVLCDIQKDFQILNQAILMLQQFCQILEISKLKQKALMKARTFEEKWVRQIVEDLKEYQRNLDGNGKKLQKDNISNIIKSTSKLQYLVLTLPIHKIISTYKAFMLQGVPEFFMTAQVFKKKDLLNSYVYNRISNKVRQFERPIIEKENMALLQQEKKSQKGLHIVLESAALSEIYFHKYMRCLKKTLFRYNQEYRNSLEKIPQIDNFNKIKVSSITVTGYQSLIVFLHATDLLDHEIEEQVWALRNMISIDKDQLTKKQKSLSWLKMTPILLREVVKKAQEKSLDIFTCIETSIKNNSEKNSIYEDIKNIVQSQMDNVQLSKEELAQEIDISINFVMSILANIESTNDTSEKKVDELIRQMALAAPSNDIGKYTKKSQKLKQKCQFLFKKYHEIVKYIAYSSPIIMQDVLRILSPEDRKLAWKGAILPGVLSGKQIKQYVKKILDRLKLKPDTTLKQFYNVSKKKIQINLSVVEQSLVSILNRVTRPNMPVWAAIVAAASIPEFYLPVPDRQQWKYKASQQFELRKLRSYFERQKKSYTFLSSSLALTTMPLDLLQNGQFRKKINLRRFKKIDKQSEGEDKKKTTENNKKDNKNQIQKKNSYSSANKNQTKKQSNSYFDDSENQIYLVFSFQNFVLSDLNTLMFTQRQQKDNQQYLFNITPLTTAQVIRQFVSFIQLIKDKFSSKQEKQKKRAKNESEGIKNVQNIGPIVSKKKILNLYVESHDNLIKNLYKKQLVLMPIRFSTLDFNLMISQESKGTANEKLSDICEDAIMQAYYALKQKWESNYQQKQYDFPQEEDFLIDIPIMNKMLEDGQNGIFNPKNSRLLYLRIQSEMFGQLEQKNNNKIKIRFLSLLNTSREIYQQYFAFIRGFRQDGTDKYIQMKQQALILSSDQHQKISLKIEYPNPSKLQIRVSYFQLDLSHLFKLNSQLKTENKERFGFVYCLKFNTIYSQYTGNIILSPKDPQKDYMNKELANSDYKSIGIKSDIKQTIYQKIMCKECVYPFTIHLKSEQKSDQNFKYSSQSYVTCDKCKKVKDPLRKHYFIQLDQKQMKLKCLLGHSIVMDKDNDKLKNKLCDLCGKGSIDPFWKGVECNLSFCQHCRDSNMTYL